MRIKCALDQDGCMDLLTVLRIMNQISQEQAWAIAYELAALIQRLAPAANCATIESLAQIYLHSDGFIHEKSIAIEATSQLADIKITKQQQQQPQSQQQQLCSNNNNNNNSPQQQQPQDQSPPTPPITPELNEVLRRRPARDEAELVASLGIALFRALDYGIPDDEERKLCKTMEYLIFQSQTTNLSLNELIDICIKRLTIATKSHAEQHYRNVCKSLINDTIELSIFLDKIYTASLVLSDITTTLDVDYSPVDKGQAKQHHHHHHHHHHHQTACRLIGACDDDLSELGEPLASLRALKINDWARLWMQVIRELKSV